MTKCYECGKDIPSELQDVKVGHGRWEKKPVDLGDEFNGKMFCRDSDCIEKFKFKRFVLGFSKKLDTMTSQQKKSILDFDRRIHTLYDHKKYIRELGMLVKEYEIKGLSAKPKILAQVDKILKEILVEFNDYIKEEIKDEETAALMSEKKKEAINVVQQIDFQESEDLKKFAANVAGDQLKKNVIEYFNNIKQKIKDESVGLSLEKHFDKILEEQKHILAQQKKFLIAEYKTLLDVKKAVLGNTTGIKGFIQKKGYYNVGAVQRAFIDLKKNYEGVYSTLIGENERVIKPFNKYLKSERTMIKKLSKYEDNAEITYYDVSRDLQTMTRADEVRLYFDTLDSMLQAGHIKLIKESLGEKAMHMIKNLYPTLNIADLEKYIPLRLREEKKDFIKFLKRLNTAAMSKKFDQLKLMTKFAYIDHLTGIPNRRYYDEQMMRHIRRADDDEGYKFSLISFDIDKFKDFNDFYGHEIGDVVLKEVAKIVSKDIKGDKDLFARVGGEEFAIILSGCSNENAIKRAEEIREHLQEFTIRKMTLINTKALHFEGEEQYAEAAEKLRNNLSGLPQEYLRYKGKMREFITISLGVATYPDHLYSEIVNIFLDESSTSLQAPREVKKKTIEKAADLALYKAKDTPYMRGGQKFPGRNQAINAEDIDVEAALNQQKEEKEKDK